MVTLLNAVAVAALYLLVRRYFSSVTTWLLCAAWVLVPNHNAMTVWAANTQSVVAFALLAGGGYLLSRGSWIVPGFLLAASALAYQLTIFPALAAAVVIGSPLLPLAPDAEPVHRTLRLRDRACVIGLIVAATGWASVNPTYPIHYFAPSQWVFLSAHFGEGLFARTVPTAPRLFVEGAAVVGVIVTLAAFLRGQRQREDGPVLVISGITVMALGSLGVLITASQAFGMTDRLYAVTSVGAVMVWLGIFQYLYRHWPQPAVAVSLSWCVPCVFGQVVSLSSWSQAGDDVVALMHHLDEVSPSNSADLVVGPQAVRRNNVVGLVSPYAPDNALWLHRGAKEGSLRIAKTPDEFVVQQEGEILIT